ncbi:MAG: T9SS type A sorting domain-containing protein [Xanthomarina gelatinilytica]|uniref:T9SS type A sorting domain-containing protein n=1 Tax=Xanthomarina gelatinilytica TaxID=1137281 RepID=UPI003A8AD28D
MKKQLLYTFTFFYSLYSLAQVYTGDLTISSQSEIDSFNYSEITGTLTIEEATAGDIINLNGLSTLTTINGGLSITNNTSLGSLNGLDNLAFIGTEPIDALGNGIGLNIVNNSALSSIVSLTNVTSIGSNLTITDNQSLLNLLGLESITSINGNIYISNNSSLSSLNGLNNLTSVNQGSGFFTGFVTIQNNNSLTTLNGLSSLNSITRDLKISNNSSLTSLVGLDNLSDLNIFKVSNNNSLTSLNGIGDLTNFYAMSITHNSSLVSLDGFNNGLTTLNANLLIANNQLLTSINALGNISSIVGHLEISSNVSLENLNGLNNLVSISGDLNIGNALLPSTEQGNISLTTLQALNNLTSIGGDLIITGCNNLTSLNGLENITTLNGDLRIGRTFFQESPEEVPNPLLTDLCGISHLIINGEVSPEEYLVVNNGHNPTYAEIQDNNTCSVASGDDGNGTYGGNLIISNQSQVDNFSYTKITGFLLIEEDVANNIQNLNGLNELTSVGGNLIITNNTAVNSLGGLENLSLVNGKIIIDNNSSLLTLSGLDGVVSINESMSILNNNSLQSIDGVNSLVTIGDTLVIYNNPSLTSINGFQNLTSIENAGFDENAINIVTVSNGSLGITNNNSLTSINGFANLNTIHAFLSIQNNPLLTSINGINSLSNFVYPYGPLFNIKNNSSFSDYCTLSYIISDGLISSSSYDVTGNAYNPTYQDIVNGSCSLSIEEFESDIDVSIYPNPTTDFINIQANFDINSVEIYSLHGQKVLAIENQKTINISLLPEGIYFLKVKTEKSTVTKKIIKK